MFPLYFSFCHFAKCSPLDPLCPRSFVFCVGFILVATVPCKSSWGKKKEKKKERKKQKTTHRTLLSLAGWISSPVEHLIIYCSFHQLFLDLFWSWADRSQLTKHKPRLGGSPGVCLALAAANGEAAFQGTSSAHLCMEPGRDTVSHLGQAATNLIPPNKSRKLSAANHRKDLGK